MSLSGTRTLVGFGFGAIQAGLFLYEAFRSGAFKRLVVAEVMPDVVAAVKHNGGRYALNIVHPQGMECVQVGPVELVDPNHASDRERLVDAVAEADELATAVPSVAHFTCAGAGSLHRVLAQGFRKKVTCNGPRAVVYAAENHNHAAEILSRQVSSELPSSEREAIGARIRFLNTVVGKMSGILSDSADVSAAGLMPVTPDSQRAFLVERFNRILISRIDFEPMFQRGISVFEEKDDLLPFEEAKLYGHNATHALAAYMGSLCGVPAMAALPERKGMMAFLRRAFVEESGAALNRRYAGVDPLFSLDGFAAYADDLLSRMTNPCLRDLVERVGRDPQRKLGWDDRLIGTMRMVLSQDLEPRCYALGAAAALARLAPDEWLESSPAALLDPIWQDARPEASERERVLASIGKARNRLADWRASGCPDPDTFFKD